jgi:hypothetical protein
MTPDARIAPATKQLELRSRLANVHGRSIFLFNFAQYFVLTACHHAYATGGYE